MIRFVYCTTLVLLLTAPLIADDNWASFQNGGRLEVSKSIPLNWSEDKGINWTKKLAGYGQSSPIIWKDHVYVTWCAGANKEKLFVQALQLNSGDSAWEYEVANSSPQKSTNYVSKAAPTPVADGDGVIAFFEGGNLIALTHEGKVRWERDLVKDLGKIESRHGLGSSLEQNDERVFVWVERSESPYVMAVDKKPARPFGRRQASKSLRGRAPDWFPLVHRNIWF